MGECERMGREGKAGEVGAPGGSSWGAHTSVGNPPPMPPPPILPPMPTLKSASGWRRVRWAGEWVDWYHNNIEKK